MSAPSQNHLSDVSTSVLQTCTSIMKIKVNGETQTVDGTSLTVGDLLTLNSVEHPETVSVQLNGKFVDSKLYPTTIVRENDEIDFVKTKLALESLTPGQRLKVLLDDGAPIQNVPRSVAGEGHKILYQVKEGGYWSVMIEKS
jgi:thiamine biosynthesis protein ThiS